MMLLLLAISVLFLAYVLNRINRLALSEDDPK
jgi:hypothetical protein